VLFSSKLLALMGQQVVLVVALMRPAESSRRRRASISTTSGLYLKTLSALPRRLLGLCAIALFVHVVVNDKAVGHVVMILYFIVTIALPILGYEHHLYRIGTLPDFKLSG